jgi:negative regulator of replication initiation
MSRCHGDISLATKVDRDMNEYVDSEAERLGVSKAEFHRRLLELYRQSRREDLDCPHCEEAVVLDLRVEA